MVHFRPQSLQDLSSNMSAFPMHFHSCILLAYYLLSGPPEISPIESIEQSKDCAYRVRPDLLYQSLGFWFGRHLFSRLDLFSSHLISSHRNFSWKLLIASHCHRSLCHPTSSHVVFSQGFSSISSISSHLIPAFLSSSQLVSAHLMSSHFSQIC